MSNLRHELLWKILSQPTAPFREGHVRQCILDEFDAAGVPFFLDPIGNIVVGVSSKAEYLKLVRARPTRDSDEPLRMFIAHMDHPGFHGVRWLSPQKLAIKWHGGSPLQLLDGADVWLAGQNGWAGSGKLGQVQLTPTGRFIDTATVDCTTAELNIKYPDATSLFGGFQFQAPVWQEGDLIHTKAADDLVGAFAVCSLALDLFAGSKGKGRKKSSRPPFLGLLTRAEEVGFVGAIAHFELGWLKNAKRRLICISLETSRTLEGALIGKGPVVRLGDRSTVFHAGALKVFTDLAKRVLPDRHQRRIMDGGTCEATAATAYGHDAIGISIPLGNYHNQSFEGGSGSRGPQGPGPEFVHIDDVRGLLILCHELLKSKLAWKTPWASQQKDFRNSLRKYRPLLKSI